MTKKTEKQEGKSKDIAVQPSATKKVTKVIETSIYAGPNVPGGALARYTVFRDGVLAPHVKQVIERYPAVKRLIVPVSKLATVQAKLNDSESAESAQYKAIIAEFKKGER